jgi:hypothetical protein
VDSFASGQEKVRRERKQVFGLKIPLDFDFHTRRPAQNASSCLAVGS